MGAMGDSGRLGIILLVMAFLAPCVLMTTPVAASTLFNESPAKTLIATQYNSSALFQSDVCFNDHSWAIKTDRGIKDFAIGDLNGDGLKDLVTISDQTNSICIYNRTSIGTLDPTPWRIDKAGMINLTNIAIGLIDDDNLLDIAVSSNDSFGNPIITIFYQTSHFSILTSKTLPLSLPIACEIQIGLFNGNNRSVAVACQGSPTVNDDCVNVWRYPFRNVLLDRITIPLTNFKKSQFLASGDINGDGKEDLVVGEKGGPNATILLQPETFNPSWQTLIRPIDGQASDIELADIMGLGRLDLVFANSQNSMIYVYRNKGTSPFYNSTPDNIMQASNKLSCLAIGEFSSGPGVDILALSDSNNASAFTRSSGSRLFTNSPSLAFPVNANPLKAIVDRSIVDKEGVFVLSQGASDSSNGSIEFFNTQPSLKGNADINILSAGKDPTKLANGKLLNGNVVVAATLPGSNQVQIFEKNTSKIFLLNTPSRPLDVAFGNFDGDSSDDLAVLCSGLQISIFPGYRLMTATNPITNIALAMNSPQSILAANLRENGRNDLIVSYNGGAQIIYNSLNSEPFNSTPLVETLGIGINGLRTAIVSADLNNDTHVGDIAILNRGASTVEIYNRNNASSAPNIYPNTPSSTLSANGVGLIDMTIGNFGGTSKQDIAVTDTNQTVQIFVQPAFGFIINFSASTAIFKIADTGLRIVSGDLNDDGKDDLMIGYDTIPAVAVFLQDAELSFANVFNLTGGGNATGIIARDINGDLRDDVAYSSPVSHSLSIWYQKNLEPKAVAVPSKYSEYEGRSISFTGNGSRDSYSDQWSLDYNWTFFPTTYKKGIFVTYTYPKNGTYQVSLRVTDRDGLSNWSNLTMIVLDTSPTADFSISSNPAIEGTNVSFQDNSTAWDPIVDRFWTFGDGAVASGAHVSHVYNRSGNFLITFRITDSDGSANSTSKTISVINVDPVADFSYSPDVPLEGEAVQFNDRSFTFNYLVSWAWNFGDGGTSNLRDPVHTYQSNGTYNVTLTVVESDNSTSIHYRLISIADTSPIIISLRTADDKNSYSEDQTILFEVTAAPGYEPIVAYQWDLNFSSSFTATPQDSLVNHTSHQYTETGTYEVSIRVWDHDSYREATQSQVLVIEITDPPPIASFNFRNVTSGTIQLDASSSSDTPSDIAGLLFSWNFNDGSGDSAWSTTSILNHTFAFDGEYSIKLRVKDDSNQINETTRTILIDRIAPYIFLSGESPNFLIGEAIQVSVTVHDPNGVSNVTLHYRIENATEQILAMTPSGTAGIYVAQISPQNHSCTISYWVTAADSSYNIRTTGHLVITVSATLAESQYIILALSAILIIVVFLLLFMRSAMVPVDEVFIIYNDGRLMAHQTRRLKPGMDDEILSSMLVAIQSFVKDSFKDESSTHLQRLDFGEKKILVERGDSFYLAVVLHSHRAGNVPHRMQAVIADIHREYGLALNEWDGDLEKVRGVKDQTDKLFKSPIPLALPGLKKEKAHEPSECTVCGFAVDPKDEKCPSCGAKLSGSTVDSLEDVAKSFEETKDEIK